MSITDVKSEVTVNFSPSYASEKAVVAPLVGAQALGRVVRSKEGVGLATTIWGDGIPKPLRFRTEDIMAPDFGVKAKRSLLSWDAARAVYKTSFDAGLGDAEASRLAGVAADASYQEQFALQSPVAREGDEAAVGEVEFEIQRAVSRVGDGDEDKEEGEAVELQHKIKEGVAEARERARMQEEDVNMATPTKK